jgi:hypothetical protein
MRPVHFKPRPVVSWQSRYLHPVANPQKHFDNVFFFRFRQFSFQHFKRPDGVMNEHEQHIPVSSIRNLRPS